MKKIIFTLVFVPAFFLCAICAAYAPEGKLFVTMLDVGQGDSILIETPTQNILIDTGDVSARKILVDELKKAGVTRFERIILTHPHADHIGGVSAVLKNFPVDEISDNGFPSANPLYGKYREAKVKFSSLKAGDVLKFGDGVYFEVFAPDPFEEFNSVNNQSIIGKLIFGEVSVLFTGDAGQAVEKALLKSPYDLSATILKAAHHGSKSSNSKKFVNAVAPDYVLISASIDNKYGHPHKRSLETFADFIGDGDVIFCTAFNGTVRVETDGSDVEVFPEHDVNWLDDYLEE